LDLVAHLGMSGRFRYVSGSAKPCDRHDHLIIELSNGSSVVFNDFRRFGRITALTGAEMVVFGPLLKLGPDPFTPGFAAELAMRLRRRRVPVKVALLDQALAAGVGNIYACESLFAARLHPLRQANQLGEHETARLADAIIDVLNRAIAAGGATLSDYRG